MLWAFNGSKENFPLKYVLSLTMINREKEVKTFLFFPWKSSRKISIVGNDDDFFIASSLLRALRNFQFLFCALSIQCRKANVAA